MNRRGLIKVATMFTAGFIGESSALGHVRASNLIKDKAPQPPHAEAIALVVEKKSEEISKAELKYFREKGTDWFKGPVEKYWWNDVLKRTWSVFRPFVKTSGPEMDMSHVFLVTYTIEETEVMRWAVDTRMRDVRSAPKGP